MKKIKRIFVGMCMMLMLFSSDVVAQTFVDGATAISTLNQELPVLNSSYFALDKSSPSFVTDASAVKLKYRAVELILELVDGNSSALDVETILREVVINDSEKFNPIDEVDYNQADYGSAEIISLQSYLHGILTN